MTEIDYCLNKFFTNKYQIADFSLKYAKDFFRNNFKVQHIRIGVELEFYLNLKNDQEQYCNISSSNKNPHGSYTIDDFIELCNGDFFIAEIGQIKKEQGLNQIEFSSKVYHDLIRLCHDLDALKTKLAILANNLNFEISFKAFNNLDDCPSSLQFNISYADNKDSDILKDSLLLKELTYSNLLNKTNQILFMLAPAELDYLRYSKELNKKLFSNAKYNSPVNLSIGLNNRTCAIRIPDCKKDGQYRIEYRVASSNSNHWLALSVILLSLCSFDFNKNQYQLTFGNAFDDNYNSLIEIIDNLNLAKDTFFNSGNIIFNQFLRVCDSK